MSYYKFDVLVIGCGVAGLTSAIKLAEKNLKVGIVTREEDPKISNTYWAQGGIVYNNKNLESLVDDIKMASAYTNNDQAAQILAHQSAPILEELLLDKAKTPFERNDQGELSFTKEAAHSGSRILYKGDYTGKEIVISLLNYLKDEQRFPNVRILSANTAIDLITPIHHGVSIKQRYEPGKVVGAYLYNQRTGEVIKAMSKVTILATGGVGALYLHHSNSEGARGDGHAMAKRAGATITDMEFIQFHPTTFYDRSSHRRFLISEALRGEGGVLVNSQGKRFMEDIHPDLELAPRDVVARAILDEMISNGDDCVYLDISHKKSEWIKERFPTIDRHLTERRINMAEEPIPVVPAAHYTCGGVKVDEFGRTNVQGLYAVGEVACTGLHGANRLASTSLLEGLTWGYKCAEAIGKSIREANLYDDVLIKNWELAKGECDLALVSQDRMTLKQTMWNYLGLTRSKNRLGRAKAMLVEMAEEIGRFYRHAGLHDELIGLRNGVEVALMVLNASVRNKESVGCFYRKDS